MGFLAYFVARILRGTPILSASGAPFVPHAWSAAFYAVCHATQDLRPNPLGMQPMNFLVKSLSHARTEGETINRIVRIGCVVSGVATA